MITNPTLQILSSFEKLGNPEIKAEPKKDMGMMSRSDLLFNKCHTKATCYDAREIQMQLETQENTKEWRQRRWNNRLIDLFPEWQ